MYLVLHSTPDKGPYALCFGMRATALGAVQVGFPLCEAEEHVQRPQVRAELHQGGRRKLRQASCFAHIHHAAVDVGLGLVPCSCRL